MARAMTETGRIAYGEEVRATGSGVVHYVPARSEHCPDCGVRRGRLHEPVCHLEQCPVCEEPLAHCAHRREILG